MRRTTYADAIAALDRLATLGHQRAETAVRAVEVGLAAVGADRLKAAVDGDPAAVGDRRIVAVLADVERAAVDLARIPQRGRTSDARAEQWQAVLRAAGRAALVLRSEIARTHARAVR